MTARNSETMDGNSPDSIKRPSNKNGIIRVAGFCLLVAGLGLMGKAIVDNHGLKSDLGYISTWESGYPTTQANISDLSEKGIIRPEEVAYIKGNLDGRLTAEGRDPKFSDLGATLEGVTNEARDNFGFTLIGASVMGAGAGVLFLAATNEENRYKELYRQEIRKTQATTATDPGHL